MADFLSTKDLERIARDAMLTKNSNLTNDILTRPGSDANAVMAAPVSVGDAVTGQLIRVQGALFSTSAKGADLDRLLFDRYQLVRKPASPSVGTETFTVPSPVVTTFTIPQGQQLKTSDGRVFTVTEDSSFGAGTTVLVDVPIQSVLAGLNQQASINTITSIITAIPGAPAGITATNDVATAGGSDSESDEDFAARGQLAYKTQRRGTLPAIEEGALAVPGVKTATAFEVIDGDGTAARLAQVVVADEFTEQLIDATSTTPAYEAQSQQLALNVASSFLDIRAAGIQVPVTVGNLILIGITLVLRFRAGANTSATISSARASMVAYTNGLRPGEPWVVADAETVLSTIPGLIVLGGEISDPAGDVIPSATQVIRTSLDLVTIGFCEVAS